MKEVKLTANQTAILNVLAEGFAEGAFAAQVAAKVEGKSLKAVNATLASLASKGVVTKSKEACGEKVLTKYVANVQ